jgi:hypothetical protein
MHVEVDRERQAAEMGVQRKSSVAIVGCAAAGAPLFVHDA